MIAVLLAWATALASTAPGVVATASKTEVSVGETFFVEVTAAGPPGCTFAFPPELPDEKVQLTAEPGSTERVHRYRAAVFALEDVAVPPIPVRYRLADGTAGEVRTEALPLRVGTLLPKNKDEQKLADVRGPVRLAIGRLFWIALGAGVALLAALAVWLWWRRRRRVPAVAALPIVPADEEAKRALEALAATGHLPRGEYRAFYIALTSIAKRYLERRLSAPIVEMTTAEMLAFLRQPSLPADMSPLLRDLSGAADRIKFALGSGAMEEGERHLQAVRGLVDDLEARLAPQAPDGKAA